MSLSGAASLNYCLGRGFWCGLCRFLYFVDMRDKEVRVTYFHTAPLKCTVSSTLKPSLSKALDGPWGQRVDQTRTKKPASMRHLKFQEGRYCAKDFYLWTSDRRWDSTLGQMVFPWKYLCPVKRNRFYTFIVGPVSCCVADSPMKPLAVSWGCFAAAPFKLLGLRYFSSAAAECALSRAAGG